MTSSKDDPPVRNSFRWTNLVDPITDELAETYGDKKSAKFLPWSSVDRIAVFDAFSAIGLIEQRPLLMIVGDRAVTSWMSVEAFQQSAGPKELHWIEGASHVDLYDKEQYVGPAITKLTKFYRATVSGTEAAVAA